MGRMKNMPTKEKFQKTNALRGMRKNKKERERESIVYKVNHGCKSKKRAICERMGCEGVMIIQVQMMENIKLCCCRCKKAYA